MHIEIAAQSLIGQTGAKHNPLRVIIRVAGRDNKFTILLTARLNCLSSMIVHVQMMHKLMQRTQQVKWINMAILR